MSDQSQPRFFRYDQPLEAIAAGEPSLALLKIGRFHGLLLSESAREAPGAGKFYLEKASLILHEGDDWPCREAPEIAIYRRNGRWIAEDTARRESLGDSGGNPFELAFISREDYEKLRAFKHQQSFEPIFQFAATLFRALADLDASIKTFERLSPLFRRTKEEEAEISRHKWLESEKAGHDVGLDNARASWIVKHRSKWQKNQRSDG